MSARRQEILAIAGEMFATKGFGPTTVREIADAAGILSGSLYHHFDSKESMVDEILTGFLDDVTSRSRRIVDEADDPVQALRDLIAVVFDAVIEHHDAVAVMQNELALFVAQPRFAHLRAYADEGRERWVSVLEWGMKTGAFRADLDARLVYRFIREAVWVTVRWFRPDGQHSIAHVRDTYLTMLLDGIAAPARRRPTRASRRPTSRR